MQSERKNLLTVSRNLPNSRRAAAGRPKATLPGTEEILALADSPEVRADQVARGKALVADPNYPSRQQVKQIANLLAANWQTRSSIARMA